MYRPPRDEQRSRASRPNDDPVTGSLKSGSTRSASATSSSLRSNRSASAASLDPIAAQSTRRQRGPWADDRLGTALRDGFADLRQAQPAAQVWHRIAAATVDAHARPATADTRVATAPVAAHTAARRPSPIGLLNPGAWLDLRRLAFIGTVSALVLAAGMAAYWTPLSRAVVGTRMVAEAPLGPDGFSDAERRIQPGVYGRLVNRLLPPDRPHAEPATAKLSVLAN